MENKRNSTFWNFFENLEGDKVVWIIALMLMLISIVCTFSSTSRLLVGDQTRLDIVKSHMIVVIVGMGLIAACYNIKKISIIRWLSKWGFLVSFVLLSLLLSKIDLPFLKSIEINGARRILKMGGLQIHVFEVIKVAMIMYLSWALDALKKGELKGPEDIRWKKALYLYLPFLAIFLMVLPGSNTAALFIGGIMFLTILLGGGNLKDMAVLAAAGTLLLAVAFGLFSLTKNNDTVMFQRIGTAISRVFDDTDYEKIVLESKVGSKEYYDALDEIRQPYSAKIAIKEGGFFGKGPGQSTQRYVVPDISEDYMFSFIIEEYGLWGAVIVILLYLGLLARGSIIARNCGKDTFAKLTVAGLSLLITGQAFLHMFVNADIGPMTGQTLPLISHGNSAFLCFSLAIGIILSISRIAAKEVEKEQKNAGPLMEMTGTAGYPAVNSTEEKIDNNDEI